MIKLLKPQMLNSVQRELVETKSINLFDYNNDSGIELAQGTTCEQTGIFISQLMI